MNVELMNKFKNFTGNKMADVAERFGVSRQFISQVFKNNSLTYQSSASYYLNIMIDEKIEFLKWQIEELELLKSELEENVWSIVSRRGRSENASGQSSVENKDMAK